MLLGVQCEAVSRHRLDRDEAENALQDLAQACCG